MDSLPPALRPPESVIFRHLDGETSWYTVVAVLRENPRSVPTVRETARRWPFWTGRLCQVVVKKLSKLHEQ